MNNDDIALLKQIQFMLSFGGYDAREAFGIVQALKELIDRMEREADEGQA